jgi:tetraacyldisaccharide 4'-kinase
MSWLASCIWSSLSWVAREAAKRGWLKNARLPARVISVGNLQAGGAGKTPLVACIAREAQARGLKTAILCRGYGGEWERRGGVIAAKADGGPEPVAAECGDEAALLHDLAPHAVIGVGSDRVKQFERIRALATVDLVILDDGFQHWRIQKDVEVVALTSATRRQTVFREWPKALMHAHLAVWTKGDTRPDTAGMPFARVRYRLTAPPIAGAEYWLVTGVADGKSVRNLAEAAGYRITQHLSFRDHARYSEAWVEQSIRAADRAGARIAVTGKDWVKWRDMKLSELGAWKSRVTVLEPELEWIEGKDEWNRVLWGL